MSLNPENLFEAYIPPPLIQQGEDLTKMHYGINLGAMELRINMYQFTRPMRRGIIYPITPHDRQENNSDSTDEINEIVQQYYQPGVIAQAIERDFQDKGFRVLRNVTGRELKDVQEMHNFFRFEDVDAWPNSKITEFLKECVTKKKFPDMAQYLITQLNVINGYQLQHMMDAKKSINDGLKPGLSEYDKLVCKAIGRNPSDYEINEVERRKAATEAQQGVIQDFAKTVVSTIQGAGAAAAVAPDLDKKFTELKEENEYLRSELKRDREQMKEQQETLKRLEKFMKDNSRP